MNKMPHSVYRYIFQKSFWQGEIEIGIILAFVSDLERLGGPIRDLVGSYRQIADARMRYKTLLDVFPDSSPHRT